MDENWIVGISAVIAALLIAGGIWFGVTHNWGCPKGSQLVVTGYYPVTSYTYNSRGTITGSYVAMSPIYACEASDG